MPGHMGVDRVTTLNLKVVQTDVERGLILVEGAVPGAKGGWITVRDAVKKALPKDAAEARQVPAGREARGGRSRATSRRPRRRARDMELKVTTLDGKAAGVGRRCRTRSSVSSRAPTSCSAASSGSSPSASAAPTTSRTAPRSTAPARRCTGRRAPAAPATARPQVNLFRGGGRSFGPTPRSHAIDLPKKVRALALKHALSAKAKDGGIIVLDKADA